MADPRLEPVSRTVPQNAPPPEPDPEFHCPNCALLGDPTNGTAFWACQNLCIRD